MQVAGSLRTLTPPRNWIRPELLKRDNRRSQLGDVHDFVAHALESFALKGLREEVGDVVDGLHERYTDFLVFNQLGEM
jgi:hypothetical protein